MSTEYWLISAPGDKSCQQTWEKMNHATLQSQLCTNYKFHIPDLKGPVDPPGERCGFLGATQLADESWVLASKVGTLDQLVGLSDDLSKLDLYVEATTRKMSSYLGEVLENDRDKLAENLLANQIGLGLYLTRFQWEMAKFPIKQSLRGIVDAINNQVSQIENDLKTKSSNYNNLKSNLANMERKQSGSLLTRNLGDIVKKEYFVQNSEYLVTLLVVVPKSFYHDWQAKYEHLSSMVVPRSSKLIFEDSDHGLFTVTLFSKVVDEYKLHARENKFVVRDFTYNEEQLAAGKNELSKLINDKKKNFGPLVRWLKVNFSECFICWIHVKAIRMFVESVLRYGLPVNFQPILIHPNKKSMKRLRDTLNNLYAHLDSTATGGSSISGTEVDIPGLGFNTAEYYPYVYFKINIDMIGDLHHA